MKVHVTILYSVQEPLDFFWDNEFESERRQMEYIIDNAVSQGAVVISCDSSKDMVSALRQYLGTYSRILSEGADLS